MNRIPRRAVALAVMAATALGTLGATMAAQAAGSVEVDFVRPASYSDIGFGVVDRERHLQTLQDHFQSLSDRLPGGHTLRIEVLDVDLAGEVWPTGDRQFRVLRGGADWPRMTLRYELRGPEGTLKAGEERLADMAYRVATRGEHRYQGTLGYERRMIDRWFADTFEDH